MRIAVLWLVALAATGCASAAPQSAADCADRIRVGDVIYTSYTTTTDDDPTPHATAERADCEDTGPDPRGSVFPDDPTPVDTWTFDGFPPAQVLGVAYGKDSFGVFIADTVPADNRDRILGELAERREETVPRDH